MSLTRENRFGPRGHRSLRVPRRTTCCLQLACRACGSSRSAVPSDTPSLSIRLRALRRARRGPRRSCDTFHFVPNITGTKCWMPTHHETQVLVEAMRRQWALVVEHALASAAYPDVPDVATHRPTPSCCFPSQSSMSDSRNLNTVPPSRNTGIRPSAAHRRTVRDGSDSLRATSSADRRGTGSDTVTSFTDVGTRRSEPMPLHVFPLAREKFILNHL